MSRQAFPAQQHPPPPTPTSHNGTPAAEVLLVYANGVGDFDLGNTASPKNYHRFNPSPSKPAPLQIKVFMKLSPNI